MDKNSVKVKWLVQQCSDKCLDLIMKSFSSSTHHFIVDYIIIINYMLISFVYNIRKLIQYLNVKHS